MWAKSPNLFLIAPRATGIIQKNLKTDLESVHQNASFKHFEPFVAQKLSNQKRP